MPRPLPDSYRRLAAYSSRLSPGTRLYDQGAVPDRFYVVLSGEVLFEVVSEGGDPEVVAQAKPGALVGHVAAFTGRPTSAAARVDRESVVLSIPLAHLTKAVHEAPELGVRLIYAFASGGSTEEEDEAPAETSSGGKGDVSADSTDAPAATGGGGLLALEERETDTRYFFVDTTTCPVSGTEFEFLRVRTSAVRPRERESDFHVQYDQMNPTWYGAVVCPVCGYAAYLDDFTSLDDEGRRRLADDREDRAALLTRSLAGRRTIEDAVLAMDLAIRCYELRDVMVGRRAVLQHRRAWLEREAGDEIAERQWLALAANSYERAYREDKRLSEESAARMAYLVGDLAFRLNDLKRASEWLETAVRVAPKNSSGIVRTARDRLQDVRELIRRDGPAS